MAVDRYGNRIIKKDFWADGGWHAVFVLLPIFFALLFLSAALIYGVYVTFRYDPEHIKAGFLFLVFAFLAAISVIPFAKVVWTLLAERVVFTNENIVYRGFGSYAVPYTAIKHVTLRERAGPFGPERFLAIVAEIEPGKKRSYIIPRWETLAGNVLSREFSKYVTLRIFDHSMLSSYAHVRGREWWLSLISAGAACGVFLSFLVARSSTETGASIVVFFWFLTGIFVLLFLVRYISRKKDIVFL